jgi:pimeloyl-ACP methyl ester carboxylesterase
MPEFRTDDDVRLHYVVHGEGPLPIIYLHWMGGDAGNWNGLWTALDDSRFCHVALDVRGHGQSERTPSLFTIDRLARDVLQLADELESARFVLAGHSFGGKVALMVAAKVPLRVAGLILFGSVGPAKVPLSRETVESILTHTAEADFVRGYFRPWFTVWPRAELDYWIGSFAHTPAWAHRAVCEIALWTDITREIAEITTPTLVIAGEHDPAYGPAYQEAAVLPAVPNARMVTVDCGHGLILERPEEVATHCGEFLESLTWLRARENG